MWIIEGVPLQKLEMRQCVDLYRQFLARGKQFHKKLTKILRIWGDFIWELHAIMELFIQLLVAIENFKYRIPEKNIEKKLLKSSKYLVIFFG